MATFRKLWRVGAECVGKEEGKRWKIRKVGEAAAEEKKEGGRYRAET